MSLKTFDPQKVSLILGTHIVSGFAADEFINVSREADNFADITGADGEVARGKINDKRGNIVITLLQTSESNDFLSTIVRTDELTGGGVFDCLIRDVNGTTLVNGAEAWILKPADVVYSGGGEVGSREWTIRVANLDMFVGGN